MAKRGSAFAPCGGGREMTEARQCPGWSGLIHVQPPEQSRWITGMTRAGVTVYLQTMFVRPGDRGGGVGEALVRHVHAVLDARGVDTTLLHFAQLNPLSAPFWSRMGYRPLWTGWEVRPAASLR